METKYVIYLGIAAVVIINFIIMIYIISGKREKGDSKNIHESSYENRDEYLADSSSQSYKTVKLGVNQNQPQREVSREKKAERMVFPEVSNLDIKEKTELLRRADENSLNNSKCEETAVLGTELGGSEVEFGRVCYEENGKYKEYSIRNNILCIGRDPGSCDIVITGDKFVGREHAMLYYRNNSFYLTDLNSKNGTFIGEEKLFGQRKIGKNIKFKLAKTEMEIK